MSTIRGLLSIVMVSLLVSMTPSWLVARASAVHPSSALWEVLRAPSAPDEERDPERALVVLRVWALVPDKVQRKGQGVPSPAVGMLNFTKKPRETRCSAAKARVPLATMQEVVAWQQAL
jgi:hypothetical protein